MLAFEGRQEFATFDSAIATYDSGIATYDSGIATDLVYCT